MFALNSNTYLNVSEFPARMQWGYSAWDSGPSINQDCLKALGGPDGADGWKCMFGGVASLINPFKTPSVLFQYICLRKILLG